MSLCNIIANIGASCELTTVLVSIAVLILVHIIYKWIQFRKLPPGPWGLPIIGYAPFLGEEPYKDFNQIANKYGDVFSLQLGSRFVVVFNSHEKIQKGFKNPATDGKPREGMEIDFVDNSLFAAEGMFWKRQKNFLMSGMKDLGFGKARMEQLVQHEIASVLDDLTSTKGEPFDITVTTKKISSKVMVHFTFKHGDSDVNELLERSLDDICNVIDELNFLAAYNLFPRLMMHVPTSLSGMKPLLDLKNTVYDYLEKLIDEQEESYDNNHMRNLIDIYIRYKSKEAKNPNDELCNRRLFKGNIMSLFQAGVNTTQNMLNWIFRILAGYPNIQKAIQAEIDEIIGSDGLISLNDAQNMPYTQAVLFEMDRYVSLFPLTFYHRSTENIPFDDFIIPKDACIIANLWNVHNAPDLWKEPEKFDPLRFLDENGKIIIKRTKNLVPFSIGNRDCLGEPLARMEIFLVVTIFLQNFFFTLPKGETWKFRPDVYIPAIRCRKSMVCATPRS